MATISARGCTELARVTLDRPTPAEPDIRRRKHERLYRSDGKILERTVVWWTNARYGSDRHDYGWTLRGKVRPNLTPAAWTALYTAKGWVAS